MVKSMSNLPEEVVTDILLRVSAKLLLRCKSVCKAWNSIISNPTFITFHLQRAIINSQRKATLLNIEYMHSIPLIRRGPQMILQLREQQWKSRLEGLLGYSHNLSSCPIHFDRLFIPRLFRCTPIVGSWNGIICAASFDFIYLWNPAIRQYKRLPDPTVPNTNRLAYVVIGFGYESIASDYKILKIVLEKISAEPIAQLYSSNSDSWRELKVPANILEKRKLLQKSSNVVKGVLYFENHNGLVSFDLHKEVFGVVPFPDSIQCPKSEVLDFEGSLAMVFESESGHGIDLWTLDDASEDVSWSKKFSIEVDSRLRVWIHSYMGKGLFYVSKVFDRPSRSYNIFYDYEKKETTYYGPVEGDTWETHKYTETLVSLNGFEQVGENESNINQS